MLLLLRCVVLGGPVCCGCGLVPSQVQGRAAVLLEVQWRVGPPLAAVALMLLLGWVGFISENHVFTQYSITNLHFCLQEIHVIMKDRHFSGFSCGGGAGHQPIYSVFIPSVAMLCSVVG